MRVASCVATAVGLLTAAGCSRPPPPPPSPPPQPDTVQIDALLAVQRHRPTHLSAGDAGAVFVQETDEGNDVVYRVNAAALPEKIGLSSAAVLAAMGCSGGKGNFLDLAATDNTIYFYFAASVGRQSQACLGCLSLGGKIQVLADDRKLADLSGAGDTLSIYRADMALSGGKIWLWLHSVEGSCFLQIDPEASPPAIGRPFARPTADFAAPVLTGDKYTVGAGPEGSIVIADLWIGTIWQIEPDGFAKPLGSLVGLPNAISAPAVDKQDRVVMFSAGEQNILPHGEAQQPSNIGATQFPALLIFGQNQVSRFSRTAIRVGAPFRLEDLRLSSMCPSPDHDGWIAYDAAAGELFHVHLIVRQ
jgi:hypothetical protein